MDPRYTIRPARAEELEALPAIELAAATLFAGTPHAAAVEGDATSVADFAAAQRAGHLWVAAAEDDTPVAFAFVEIVAGCAHLDELDVAPAHGRRGIGAALVREVIGWAKRQGYPALTLTTYRDVPWNAPFYRGLGFAVVREAALAPPQRELFEREDRMGLRAEARSFMRLDLQ